MVNNVPHSEDQDEHFSALAAHHLKMLREESGISDALITARGYRTVTDHKELAKLGFSSRQLQPPGLFVPIHTTDGEQPYGQFRPDKPRLDKDGKVVKYETPKGRGVRLDCPPVCRAKLGDPKTALWITEGVKKADALASHGACAIALMGVSAYKGRNAFGGSTFLADWDHIALNGRLVYIIFDNDVMRKATVQQALRRLTLHLERKGAEVLAVYLPIDGNRKIGVDDYLAAGHTIDELKALAEGPRPQPQPAPPLVELLDTAPPLLARPLALIDGRAYGATWLHCRITVREIVTKEGQILKVDPPRIQNEQRLFVIRDDGRVFGAGGDATLEELGIEVHLPEIPRMDQCWSTAGVKAYQTGRRPLPAAVFAQLIAIIDRFLDFGHSLADQHTMCEMIACYILATWFLDAFTVIGFLWPNGEWGSGKTQLLIVVASTAYLGQVILSGGSYASLRDLADYGATLGFDDAERLSDPKKSDPDKRELLLAGNRKGNTVPMKEPGPDRTWVTRRVNTFCPRLFSATQLPDRILASRTIIVPLVRTANKEKANADPLDPRLWPTDRRQLIDDLWGLALEHLASMPDYEACVNQRSELIGRDLEPWRAMLAVALWLDDHGTTGLFQRMHTLAVKYREKERPNLDSGNLTVLTIKALLRCTGTSIQALQAFQAFGEGVSENEKTTCWTLKTAIIAETER